MKIRNERWKSAMRGENPQWAVKIRENLLWAVKVRQKESVDSFKILNESTNEYNILTKTNSIIGFCENIWY